MKSNRISFLVAYLLIAAFALGCGQRTTTGGSDVNQARQLVGALADSSDNPQMIAPVFAEGCVPTPEKCRQFQRYSLWGKSAEVSGDTATITVEVSDFRSGKILTEVEWKAVKENGEWKLKETPLP